MTATSEALSLTMERAAVPHDLVQTTPVIHLIDDDPLVRHAASDLFETAGWEVRAYRSAEEFLAGQRPAGEACLVFDLALRGMSGLDLLQVLNAEGLQTPAVVLSCHRDAGSAVAALKAGAADFLEKPADQHLLFTSVADALDSYRQARQREQARITAKARFARLTEREQEVMLMILDGKPNKIIAAELNINIRTVENHRARVMSKTGASSLPDLVRLHFTSASAD
jgi:FixJ family two-component response regulator